MGGCQMPVQGDVKEHRGQNANTSATTSYIPFFMKENIIIMLFILYSLSYERKYNYNAYFLSYIPFFMKESIIIMHTSYLIFPFL